MENHFADIGRVHHVFLESGRNNKRAHSFFEAHGYTVSSVVMTKRLS